ncbi:MAG: PAS domain S-box protein [Patescibacteria group bacterium]|nr:PAS domain S-box protein [Patescibacteria group bacterium]
MSPVFLSEHRCACGKLLMKGVLFDGTVEIKCKYCKKIHQIGRIKLADDAARYLLIINNQGRIINASDTAAGILGYTIEELIGKHFTEINPTLPPEIGERFYGKNSFLDENNYLRLDTSHQSKSGIKIPVSVMLKLYEPTEERCLLVIAEVKGEKWDNMPLPIKALEFFDKGCDFYAEIDRNGVIESVSPSIEKFFGYTQNEGIGRSVLDFIPLEEREEAMKRFICHVNQQMPYRAVVENLTDKSGKLVNTEMFLTQHFNDSGEFIGYYLLGWLIKKQDM